MPIISNFPGAASATKDIVDLKSQVEDINKTLETKADLSTQDTVELTVPGIRTVTLEASELQNYLKSIPLLVTEYLTIEVSGELSTLVEVKDFYGPGGIHIIGHEFTMKNELRISNCELPVTLYTIDFQEPSSTTANDALLYITGCSSNVYLYKCTFTGHGTQGNAAALNTTGGCSVMIDSCTASNLGQVFFAGKCSYIAVSGGVYSNNNIGAYVWRGGIIMLTNNAPDLLGGASNRKAGGIISKMNGTLL